MRTFSVFTDVKLNFTSSHVFWFSHTNSYFCSRQETSGKIGRNDLTYAGDLRICFEIFLRRRLKFLKISLHSRKFFRWDSHFWLETGYREATKVGFLFFTIVYKGREILIHFFSHRGRGNVEARDEHKIS